MKSRRAYIDAQLSLGSEATATADLMHYLLRVLRLRSGDKVDLFNGDGFNYAAEISSVDKRSLGLKVLEQAPGIAPSPLQITLVQALSRGERLDYSLQKATELGVATIQLLLTERVELHLGSSRLERRMRHWRQVIIKACEQSGRSELPQLRAPISLNEYLNSVTGATRLVLNPGAKSGWSQLNLSGVEVDLITGAEGGFSDSELSQMHSLGVQGVSLGPRVLRTETAGPVAIAIVQQLYGDMRADFLANLGNR